MSITRKSLRATYERLREVYPFSTWNMPDSSEVEFRVGMSKKFEGYYLRWNTDEHRIYVSKHIVKTQAQLTLTMAHEMVHLVQREPEHGEDFDNKARQVCNSLGYDVRKF